MKKKITALNKLKKEIEQLKHEIDKLLMSKEIIETDIKTKNKEIESIENEFAKDISDFPLDLAERLERAKKGKEEQVKNLFEVDKKLYGTIKVEGLMPKRDRSLREYKKIALDNNEKLLSELNKKNSNNFLLERGEKIKTILEQNDITVEYEQLLILTRDVIGKAVGLQEEYYYKMKEDECYDKAIKEVIQEKFNIDLEYISSKLTEDELSIKKEMDEIILEINKMGIKNKSVRPYLQEKLVEGIWEKYKNPEKQTALGFIKKAFAKKYLWEGRIEVTTNRYKNFESFYKNIFLK